MNTEQKAALKAVLLKQLSGKFPAARIEEIRAAHSRYKGKGFMKFLDWKGQLKTRIAWAIDHMELHEGIKLRILDLGTGCGYLPWIARELSHEVILTDLPSGSGPSIAVYDKVLAALGLTKDYSFAIKAEEPMPIPGKFDLITATGTAFHTEWGQDEWWFFLNDLMDHLNPDGRVFFFLNDCQGKEALWEFEWARIPEIYTAEWQAPQALIVTKEG